MDISQLTISAIGFLVFLYIFRLYQNGGSLNANLVRYLGYPFIGISAAVIVAGFLKLTSFYSYFPISAKLFALLLAAILGLIGFEIAKRKPDSFTMTSPKEEVRWASILMWTILICGGLGLITVFLTVPFMH